MYRAKYLKYVHENLCFKNVMFFSMSEHIVFKGYYKVSIFFNTL